MTQAEQRSATLAEPLDKLKGEARSLMQALAERALASVRDKVTGSVGRLIDYADGGGGSGLLSAVTGGGNSDGGSSVGGAVLGTAGKAVTGLMSRGGGSGGSGGGQGRNLKVTNIVEEIDVGVPVRLAYNQWTQFTEFPSFMKKVESVEQEADETTKWKVQILWSHRGWESTTKRQIPDDRIVWTSKGQRGHVDGTVSFHELGPNLTKVLVVLEYYPQGGFEHIGNLWRAQGRRTRLELKHFRRHVMTQAVLHGDEIEGWRGVIEDGEVVKDHETALEEEKRGRGSADEENDEGEYADEADEADEGEYADEADEADEEDDGDDEADYADEDDEAEYADEDDEEHAARAGGRS
ncbi:MAG TPA: SRPBCC family protein [Streptosporangiaceae bacterium]|nr:SRPBCC family protein [Streptosporangiaceae bacterium]